PRAGGWRDLRGRGARHHRPGPGTDQEVMAMTLGELAAKIGARLRGDASLPVTGVATLAAASDGQVSFLANSKYHDALRQTRASAVILSEADAANWQG